MNNVLLDMLVNSVGIYVNVVGTDGFSYNNMPSDFNCAGMIIKYKDKYYDRKIGFVTIDNVHYEITIFNDITDIKKETMYDMKTGALTLEYFKKSLEYLIQTDDVILALVDIDDFKSVNDTFGHDTGDLVLKNVVDEFKMHLLGHNDLICRFGGDEFLLAFNSSDIGIVRNRIDSIAQYIKENSAFNNIVCIMLTFSIGLVKYNKEKTYEENFKDVDELMYIVKKNGKNAIASKEVSVKVLEKKYCE